MTEDEVIRGIARRIEKVQMESIRRRWTEDPLRRSFVTALVDADRDVARDVWELLEWARKEGRAKCNEEEFRERVIEKLGRNA